MEIFLRKNSRTALTLAAAMWLVACGAADTETEQSPAPSGDNSDGPAGAGDIGDDMSLVRGGSTSVGAVKGVVQIQFMDDGSTCSGVLISRRSILTTARCLIPHMPARALVAQGLMGIRLYLYGYDARSGAYTKRCISDAGAAATCTNTANNGKAMDLFVGMNPVSSGAFNDLGMIKFTAGQPYPWFGTDYHNYADIYTDPLPSGVTSLQLYGFGKGSSGGTLGTIRTGLETVTRFGASDIALKADKVQSCSGDKGGPYVIPPSVAGSGLKLAGLLSVQGPFDTAGGCAQVNSTETAVRLADKTVWIDQKNRVTDGVDPEPPCANLIDSAGNHYTRCYASCEYGEPTDPWAWWGCYGSGCSACSADFIESYPNYFNNHARCSRNTACGRTRSVCNSNCPPPTDADR